MGNNFHLLVPGQGTVSISLNGQQVLTHIALHVPGLAVLLYSLWAHTWSSRAMVSVVLLTPKWWLTFLPLSIWPKLHLTAICLMSHLVFWLHWKLFIMFNLAAFLLPTPPNSRPCLIQLQTRLWWLRTRIFKPILPLPMPRTPLHSNGFTPKCPSACGLLHQSYQPWFMLRLFLLHLNLNCHWHSTLSPFWLRPTLWLMHYKACCVHWHWQILHLIILQLQSPLSYAGRQNPQIISSSNIHASCGLPM